eukprot:GHVT01066183.1.p1 GENE.GHVT01066183.1~~GHVT01066183.1.p1  ORF type:complete len:343 (+),score=20.45 GHVT01066183.1:1287-2315(+)
MVHVTALPAMFQRTKLCPRWKEGHCSLGDSCTFAHGEHELRSRPDLRKTKLCEIWQKTGSCNRASECGFAHGESELRVTNEYWKTDICKYWRSGACHAGSECRHAHGVNELRARKYEEEVIEKLQSGTAKLDDVLARRPNKGQKRETRVAANSLVVPQRSQGFKLQGSFCKRNGFGEFTTRNTKLQTKNAASGVSKMTSAFCYADATMRHSNYLGLKNRGLLNDDSPEFPSHLRDTAARKWEPLQPQECIDEECDSPFSSNRHDLLPMDTFQSEAVDSISPYNQNVLGHAPMPAMPSLSASCYDDEKTSSNDQLEHDAGNVEMNSTAAPTDQVINCLSYVAM